MIVAADEYRRLTGRVPDFKEFLLSRPDFSKLQLDRDLKDLPRDVDL